MFEDLIPELQPYAQALLDAAGTSGLQPRVTSTRRSRSQQRRLYQRWQSGLSPYPAAPPGTSAHEFGWAFDLVVTPLDALSAVGNYWESLGGRWGGSVDPVHFEYPGFQPPSPEEIPESGLGSFLVDLGVGFVPVYGAVTTVAELLTLFPGLSENEALKMLASPTHYYNQARRLLSAYR